MEKSSAAAFNSEDYTPEDRLTAFQEMTASVYDARTLSDRKDFRIKTYGYHANHLMFHNFECSAMHFRRTQRHLQGDDKDFLVLHAQLAGEELLQMEHGIIRLLPGNIYLRDWAYPFDSQTSGMHIQGVMIPRESLTSSSIFNVHNPILSWSMPEPIGALLWKLWSHLFDELPQIDLGTAEVLSQGFLGFLDGLISEASLDQVQGNSRSRSMEHYLQAQLRGYVSVEELCNRFHISRATVFRMFKAHGGLNHYIDRLRLERCYSELRSVNPEQTTVGEVAAGWGYNDPKAFNRKFRNLFGVPPSKILGIGYDAEKSIQYSTGTANEHNNLFRNFKRWMSEASGLGLIERLNNDNY